MNTLVSREKPGADWHRADIVAALHKANLSLRALSQAHGLSAGALNNALDRPWPKAEKIIADAITGAKSTDPDKVAAYIHGNSFKTPIGNVEYDKKGDLKAFKFVVFTWHKDATKTEAK